MVDHFNKPFTAPNKSKVPNLESRKILGDMANNQPWSPEQEIIRKRNREAAEREGSLYFLHGLYCSDLAYGKPAGSAELKR